MRRGGFLRAYNCVIDYGSIMGHIHTLRNISDVDVPFKGYIGFFFTAKELRNSSFGRLDRSGQNINNTPLFFPKQEQGRFAF